MSPVPAPPQDTETQLLQVQVEALEEEVVQLGPVPGEETDVVVRRQPGRQACGNFKESRAQALELPDGFFVCEAGRSKAKRVHRLGVLLDGAWGGVHFVYSYKGPLMPQDHEYEEVCKRCSAALFAPAPQDRRSDTDPFTDIE